MELTPMGTRCAVCVRCGRCLEESTDKSESRWSGQRCEVCVSCGKCIEAWGLAGSSADADTVTGPTSWATAFQALDTGSAGAPPPSAPPGLAEMPSDPKKGGTAESDDCAFPSPFAILKSGKGECDTATGATPGVSSACRDLGLDSMDEVIRARGIKPPGVA